MVNVYFSIGVYQVDQLQAFLPNEALAQQECTEKPPISARRAAFVVTSLLASGPPPAMSLRATVRETGSSSWRAIGAPRHRAKVFWSFPAIDFGVGTSGVADGETALAQVGIRVVEDVPLSGETRH